MTTVGYGDVFPKSYGGRLLGAFICLWGVLLVSLFVVTISDFLGFSHPEKNSYLLIKRLVFREELRKAAGKVIASMYKFKLLNRHLKNRISGNPFLDSSSDRRLLTNADFKFRRTLLEFRKKALERRQFEDNTELIFLSKNVDNMGEELEVIKEKQEELKTKQIKIFAAIKLLCDIDTHLNRAPAEHEEGEGEQENSESPSINPKLRNWDKNDDYSENEQTNLDDKENSDKGHVPPKPGKVGKAASYNKDHKREAKSPLFALNADKSYSDNE